MLRLNQDSCLGGWGLPDTHAIPRLPGRRGDSGCNHGGIRAGDSQDPDPAGTRAPVLPMRSLGEAPAQGVPTDVSGHHGPKASCGVVCGAGLQEPDLFLHSPRPRPETQPALHMWKQQPRRAVPGEGRGHPGWWLPLPRTDHTGSGRGEPTGRLWTLGKEDRPCPHAL